MFFHSFFRLKTIPLKSQILGKLLQSWIDLFQNDEAILIEGVEHLMINVDVKKVAQKALEMASDNLKRDPYSQRSHSILFVKNKLLAMYSRFVILSNIPLFRMKHNNIV